MPLWEQYEVEAEINFVVKVNGKRVSNAAVWGEAKGSSNEDLRSNESLPKAVTNAIAEATEKAATIAVAMRHNRRRELGYKD